MDAHTNYGLVLSRHAGECLVIDGPATLHLLRGDFEALIVRQADPDAVGDASQLQGAKDSLSIDGPSIVVFIRGHGRVGIEAPRSVRIIRGELLKGTFKKNPLLAAFACRVPLEPGTVAEQLFHVTHLHHCAGGVTCAA